MPKQDLSEIVSKMPSLTIAELRAVRNLANDLLGQNAPLAPPTKTEDHLEQFFWQVHKVLRERGIGCRAWHLFTRTKNYRSFAENFTVVETYIQQYFGNVTERQRRRLYYIFALTIANWIDDNPMIPLGIRNISINLDQLPGCMRNAFPDYAENGLLPVLLNTALCRQE
jgi:hypothetical protein